MFHNVPRGVYNENGNRREFHRNIAESNLLERDFMNKEKILNKIGKMMDKANITEEDLAQFLSPEDAETPEPEVEQPKGETAQDAENPESVESNEAEGKAVAEDETPEGKTEEEPKTSSEAVPEAKPEEETKAEEKPSGDYEALKTLVDGYKAEIDSLRSALAKAGVLEEVAIKDKKVGVGVTSTPNLKRQEEGLNATLAKLNRGRN